MPDLIQSLQGNDLGHLRIIAGLWGIELARAEVDAARKELAAALLDTEKVQEMVETLPAAARGALHALTAAGGRLTWAAFTRQAGELRPAGAGRRDREQLYLHPISATEILYYRALIGRAFFETGQGLQEFAYVPENLLPLIPTGEAVIDLSAATRKPPPGTIQDMLLGRLATPLERQIQQPGCDRLLDDATTLLAAMRMEMALPATTIPVNVVAGILRAAAVLVGSEPQTEAVRAFLEMDQPAAMKRLTSAWKESRHFNELRLMPELICEGEWQNDPLATRELLLGWMRMIPRGRWWSLAAFIQDIHERTPDIQRTAGEYDTWFIKRKADGAYLRGFDAWLEVEGALIRYIICGPMYWLGLVELAHPPGAEQMTAFRIPEKVNWKAPNGENQLHVSSQGRIQVPRALSRLARYQLARFCEWEEQKADEYRYRVSIPSLKKASAQGLKAGQLLSLLAKHAAAEIPPSFIQAVKRWERKGTEARLEVRTILQVSSPEVMDELRRSKAGRFLGELLGPVTVTIRPGAQKRVLATLAELGLLAEEDGIMDDHQQG